MRSTLCKHHLRCPCGCLVAASAGSTSRGEAPACLLLLLRLLCQPAEIKHVCSSCGSSSFLPASLLSPGLPWVQRTEVQQETLGAGGRHREGRRIWGKSGGGVLRFPSKADSRLRGADWTVRDGAVSGVHTRRLEPSMCVRSACGL